MPIKIILRENQRPVRGVPRYHLGTWHSSSVPGNTRANVYLPVGLLEDHPRRILTGVLALITSLICLESDLVAGGHTIVSQ